jgi:hypothetical protein
VSLRGRYRLRRAIGARWVPARQVIHDRLLGRVRADRVQPPELAVLLDEVDHAAVGEGGDGQASQAFDRAQVVEPRGEHSITARRCIDALGHSRGRVAHRAAG